ncbi:5-formyltetrahydrofolate cyclo-ligase [Desulfonema magnum]|uniref:5-formyltetrahydrofolate cyclo-ligase n=1 Tax=Desulfonema magnum TaxID=45655 RepID=A0A975BR12_9BACT|nr:5-formyltetrahydrofolate cyclo-ligase [Desulfonema magnum]QTA90066.1 5-formyltetrahydrofolate cyclo-ligase [Desulfonema magnum]
MEEIKERKRELRDNITKMLNELSDSERSAKIRRLEDRLFDFANFLESKIPLLYVNFGAEVNTRGILKRCLAYNKIVVLPAFNSTEKYKIKLMKVDNLGEDMKLGSKGILEPDESRCKKVPIERVDIAIIPGVAFDEKGSRLGSGDGYYDKLIPKLSATTRKVGLAFESQIVQQVPMQSHDRHVDIIITDKRIIYKI